MTATWRKTKHYQKWEAGHRIMVQVPAGKGFMSVDMANAKQFLMNRLSEHAHRIPIPFFFGLLSMKLPDNIGNDFLYLDNPYFRNREKWKAGVRIIRGAFHLTETLERPADRFEALGIEVMPYRKFGRPVVVIPPSPHYVRLLGCTTWLDDTMKKLAEVTQRPVLVKSNKYEKLQNYLKENKAWAVVTYGSVAGVEAALWGYPVFSGPICPTRPISAGPLEKIDEPEWREREPWLHSLAYACWGATELADVNLEDYHYDARRHDSKQEGLPAARAAMAGQPEQLA